MAKHFLLLITAFYLNRKIKIISI